MEDDDANRAKRRLVRLLLAKGRITRAEDGCSYVGGSRSLKCDERALRELEAAGLIVRRGPMVTATAEARAWLRRQLADGDAHAAQHRIVETDATGIARNLAESPLRTLCGGKGHEGFLAPHQIAAAERVLRWAERARLQPRVTTSYGTGHIARASRRQPDPTAISDMAIEARRHLGRLYELLPYDCAEVVIDICVFDKGLQRVEQERGWPRRSAKLVLRIGLDQLAARYGLSPVATGHEAPRQRAWLGEGARPMVVG